MAQDDTSEQDCESLEGLITKIVERLTESADKSVGRIGIGIIYIENLEIHTGSSSNKEKRKS